MSTHTITLDDDQLEEVRRAMMRHAISDMQRAALELDTLASTSPWPLDGTVSSDTQVSVQMARESLDILDALGWPEDETREEWEARMAEETSTEATS